MKPIRTTKGKLFGMLDVAVYVLHIKDRDNNYRLIEVPPTGLIMQYISGNGQPETVHIPPKASNIALV